MENSVTTRKGIAHKFAIKNQPDEAAINPPSWAETDSNEVAEKKDKIDISKLSHRHGNVKVNPKDKRNHQIKYKLSDEEYDEIKKRAKGIPVGAWTRCLIFGKIDSSSGTKNGDIKELKEIHMAVKNGLSNLNQITRAENSAGLIQDIAELQKLLESIKIQIEEVRGRL